MAVQSCVVNHTIVTDPTIWEPGFSLPHHTWSLMNRFRTGQGPCHADLHKCGLAQSPFCDCGQRQTMNHIVDTINKIWRWTESTPWSGRWRSHMAGIYSDCSTRDIINRQFLFAVSARCCVSGMSIRISHRHQQRLSEVRWNADFLWLDVPVIHGRRLPESSLVLHW